MVLNSNNTSAASHRAFIQNAVAANPNITWKIMMFHHDIYDSACHSVEASILNLRASLFTVAGWSPKTVAAILGTTCGVVIAGLFPVFSAT
jgi:uncharacterized membrane protein